MAEQPPQSSPDNTLLNQQPEELQNLPCGRLLDGQFCVISFMFPMAEQPPQSSPDNTLPNQQPEELQNLPCGRLLDGPREGYNSICVPLYEASIQGDWKAAEAILHNHKALDLLGCSITENFETSLHIAATAESTEFVKRLVNEMSNEQLEFQNKQGSTALFLAAAAGNVKMVKIMVKKHPKLLKIRNKSLVTPLGQAALFEKHDMVKYLYGMSGGMSNTDDWEDDDRRVVFQDCMEADFFDVALKIFDDDQERVTHTKLLEGLPEEASVWQVLDILARKPSMLNEKRSTIIPRIINSIICVERTKEREATQLLRKIWKKIVQYPCKNDIHDVLKGKEGCHVLFTAAEMGNTKFLVELIREYPDLIWEKNPDNLSIFHIGVLYRHASIYNLLYEIGSMRDLITFLEDSKGNNMLHLVGLEAQRNPREDVSGAAFQMQHELLWFEAVKAMIPLSSRNVKNNEGHTPHALFIKSHKDLASRGEKWMKGTTSQCMVVAALLTTVVFSVAFTIPGGYDQNNGFPIFLRDGPFITFVILDAISLILSSSSILMFLSILTSRYDQEDFLRSLPEKLMIGLLTLFLSIISMMVAFTISFFVLYREKRISIPIIISAIAVVPIFLYFKLQFPLFLDAYHSTYRSRHLFKPSKKMLYHQNPRF